MIQQKIREKREEAGRALQSARELGKQLSDTEHPPANAAELTEKFDAAKADFDRLMLEVKQLERIADVETQAADLLDRPDRGNVQHRGQPGNVGDPAEAKAKALAAIHARGFIAYCRAPKGQADISMQRAIAEACESHGGVTPKEVFAHMSTQGDLGGFLTSDDFRAEVIKDLAGFAVIRRLARVEPTGSSALVFPSIQSATTDADIYSSGYTGAWKPEGYTTGGTAPPVQNQPKFGQERIPVHIWQPDAVEVTVALLEDSRADLMGVLSEAIAEVLGLDEDSAFINGNGVGKPLGLLSDAAGIAKVKTGSAAALTYDGLVDLFSTLPSQYRQNARYLMSSLTYGAILKLKDTQNRPILEPNSTPGTLWGKMIEYSEFVPDVAANSLSIIFGDFRYYGIADRQELRVQRLEERFAPNIGFLPTAREGGQPLRKAAFKIQEVKA